MSQQGRLNGNNSGKVCLIMWVHKGPQDLKSEKSSVDCGIEEYISLNDLFLDTQQKASEVKTAQKANFLQTPHESADIEEMRELS